MATLFRSDEVYKKISKNVHNREEIIPVRGMYVSGQHSSPYYAEPALAFTGITSQPAEIYSLTSSAQSTTDHVLNIINIDMDGEVTTEFFTKASDESFDTVLNIINIDFDGDFNEIEFFQKTTSDTFDTALNVLTVDMVGDPVIESLPIETRNEWPEPILTLSGITSDSASIISL